MTKQRISGGAMTVALLFFAVLLAALIGLRIRTEGIVLSGPENAGETVSVEAGLAYIRELEARDPGEVEEEIRAIRRAEQEELERQRQAELEALRRQQEAEQEAERQQRLAELAAARRQRYDDMASGAAELWPLFGDAVMLGDSRVQGFFYYGCLPENRVLAELGATILGVEAWYDGIRALDPAYIIMSFGANDLVSYLWPTGPEYAARYREAVESLQAEFPDAVIVVNSIPAITEPALSRESIFGQVPEFNEALRQMCGETGAVFVDNDFVSEEHGDLYAGDGIHFDGAFYPYWGASIMEAILEYEEGDLVG